MTKLQRKRRGARSRRRDRRDWLEAIGASRIHPGDVFAAYIPTSASPYHTKRRRHSQRWGLRGIDHRSINIARDSLARTFNAYAERWPR